MKLRNLLFVTAICLLAFALTADAAQMKPGKWQVTMQMDMPGMPFKMPPVTITHCYTQEDVAKAEATVPKNEKDKDCKVSDVKVNGDTVTWKVSCPKQQLTGEGSMTVGAESYTGTTKFKMPDNEMTQKFSGKRVGDCDK